MVHSSGVAVVADLRWVRGRCIRMEFYMHLLPPPAPPPPKKKSRGKNKNKNKKEKQEEDEEEEEEKKEEEKKKKKKKTENAHIYFCVPTDLIECYFATKVYSTHSYLYFEFATSQQINCLSMQPSIHQKLTHSLTSSFVRSLTHSLIH